MGEKSRVADSLSSVEQKTQKRLLELICVQLKTSLTAAFFGGIVLLLALWKIMPSGVLVAWFSCLTILTLIRFLLCRSYEQAAFKFLDDNAWIKLLTFTTALGGLTWGVGIFYIAPSQDSIYEVIIASTYCALAAGSIIVLSPIKKISVAFLLSSLVPFIFWQFIQADAWHFTLGCLATIYLIVLLLMQNNISQAIYDSIKLQFQNTDLIVDLSHAQEKMQRANIELHAEIKERQLAEASLKASEEQLKLITNNLPVLIAYFDRQLIFHFNNKAYEDWFGKPLLQITHKHLNEVFNSETHAIFHELCQRAALGKKVTRDFNLVDFAGSVHYISATIIPHYLNQKLEGYFSLITDLTERKRSEERLGYLATHDTLTGLANRNLFYAEADKAINRASRSEKILALLYLDLDNFKNINDSLGHDVGDQLLIEASKRIKGVLREIDTVARLGGDEFTIIIEELQLESNASLIAEKLCQALAEAYSINDQKLFITTSIGISLYPHDGLTTAELLKNADLAMYRAKEQNRNTYQFYETEMNLKLSQRIALENSLRHALEKDQFQLYYQPIYDLNLEKIVGAEALLRWLHPVRGLIFPAEFIGIAEEMGLIVSIGEWVLKEACRQVKLWHQAGLANLTMAVNLSARQIYEPNLLAMIEAILNTTGLNPAWLKLELTESLVMQGPQLIDTLIRLKQMGIGLSIDDFGTGYSSLSYLKDLPIDVLKIDRSFIKDFPQSTTILASIISMAQNLGLQVVAEGVETAQQMNYLKTQPCQFIQGYLISPPVPAAQFIQLLSKAGP